MKPVRRKVIISCAVTGRVHTPSMSDSLPFTPDQITQQAIEAARAGASILHLHARNPSDGSPTNDPAVFDLFLPGIAAQTDAILEIPVPRDGMDWPRAVNPEFCSIEMGSTNYSFSRAARGISDWRFAWEKPYLEASEDGVLRMSFRDIKGALSRFGEGSDPRYAFACHDLGHLHNLAQFLDEGLIKGPLFLQCHLGIAGGLNADPENLFLIRSTADRLFGRENYEFSVQATGRHQIPLATMGAIMGGHVRVGLGDSLVLGKGLLAASSAAQVLKIRRILEELSFEIASPDEARDILHINSAGLGEARREVGLNG
ncbi:MAG: 3-keto-5-aminohexanoate cleavage protein [Hoeflea sp.]|uniref:3-keto-5-aminohexanoate cleavage protein n=1 Tax=Hoeflea sp. TaxID=1940281 RepID=UPI0027308927|nr:3-keto-5-aminohexanoate cleavage protein [Hoeflea sp.]MDP2119037.1 3-keto-5-aminohexanoate cleavage protein [Hoeflea sp.]MDP3527361.1 3-keto-5-aminohexanoate cleavage protein [Hoeflea sp.]